MASTHDCISSVYSGGSDRNIGNEFGADNMQNNIYNPTGNPLFCLLPLVRDRDYTEQLFRQLNTTAILGIFTSDIAPSQYCDIALGNKNPNFQGFPSSLGVIINRYNPIDGIIQYGY
jgi:hypothetical protein